MAGQGRAWPEQRLKGKQLVAFRHQCWGQAGSGQKRTGGGGTTQSGSRFWKEGFGDCLGWFAQGAWGLDVGVFLLGWVESSSSIASPSSTARCSSLWGPGPHWALLARTRPRGPGCQRAPAQQQAAGLEWSPGVAGGEHPWSAPWESAGWGLTWGSCRWGASLHSGRVQRPLCPQHRSADPTRTPPRS